MAEELDGQNEHVSTAETRDLADRLSGVAWGVFFVWLGLVFLAHVSQGIALLGIGIITLSAQVARRSLALDLEGFWVVVGLLFGLAGVWQLVDARLSLLPILFIVAGLALLLASISNRHPSQRRGA